MPEQRVLLPGDLLDPLILSGTDAGGRLDVHPHIYRALAVPLEDVAGGGKEPNFDAAIFLTTKIGIKGRSGQKGGVAPRRAVVLGNNNTVVTPASAGEGQGVLHALQLPPPGVVATDLAPP